MHRFRLLAGSPLLSFALIAAAGCGPRGVAREEPVSPPTTPIALGCAEPIDATTTLSAPASLDDVMAAFAAAAPGDVLRLDGLTLDEPLHDFPSGTEEMPIVIDGRGTTARAAWDLTGMHDVVIVGVRFLSDGTFPWLTADGGIQRTSFEGNSFDVTCVLCGDHFEGAELAESDDVRFCGNRVGWWWGDMFSFVPAGRVAFIDNDFTAAAADHGVIVYTGRQLVVRGNVFRNPFDRVLHVASSEPDVFSGRALVEHNVFFDSDWDRVRERPDGLAAVAADGGGGNEIVRLIGEGHIFRDNVVVSNRRGNDTDCHAALTMSTWARDPYRNERNEFAKVYANVFLDNQTHAVSIADGLDTDGNRENHIAFNVFENQERGALAVCSDVISEDDAIFVSNRTAGDGVTLADGITRTMETVQSQFPERFSANDPSAAVFVDEAEARDMRARADAGTVTFADREGLFAALAAPAANDEPRVLTTLTDSADGTTLRVGDAFWFSSGHGVVAGDLVAVADQVCRVVEIPDRFTLVVDVPVSAPAGTPVTLMAMNRAVGVFAPRGAP